MTWAQRSMAYALMSDELLADVHYRAVRALESGEGMSYDERQATILIVTESGIEIDIRRTFDRSNYTRPEGASMRPQQAQRRNLD